jgi:phosphopantetheinyl transferase (holo-ACP synthase)
MVGNDIVDLRDADARPESFRARFDERVFSPDEQRAIAHDAKPLARRWAHWGAKEAAYKLAKQLDSTFVFSPRRLVADYAECTNYANDANDTSHASMSNRMGCRFERRGHLELPRALPHDIRMLELRSFETAERIHVVAVPVGADWGGVEWDAEALDRELDDPSVAVRAMAVREISHSLGVAAERLTIGREEGRIPTVELDGSRTPLSLSLSHHGRWISYAMRLRIDMQSQSVWTEGWTDSAGRAAGVTWTR